MEFWQQRLREIFSGNHFFMVMVVKNCDAKKTGANWRLGGNFVGCNNRRVKILKQQNGEKSGGKDVSKS